MDSTIDLQKIADDLDFDLEDIKMLIDVFSESAEENMKILKEAIESNDSETIFTSAHAIKGSSANLTLSEISDIAKEIEHNSKTGNSFNYLDRYNQLETLLSTIRA